MLFPLGQSLARSKDTPQLVIIRKCSSVMDSLSSAQIILDGFYHDNAGKKVSIHFDGVVKFPGNIDGKLKINGGNVNRDGQFRTIDGKTFYLASNTKEWIKLEPNNLNSPEQNPFFKATHLILEIGYFPEYLTGGIAHEPKTFQGREVDYFKLNIDIAKLHADSKKPSQNEQLTNYADYLTGKAATVEMWVDKTTTRLLKLSINVDGYGKSKKPLSMSITLDNFNLPTKIEKPAHL